MTRLAAVDRAIWAVRRLMIGWRMARGYGPRQRLGELPFTIDLHWPIGMGALLATALRLHAWAEEEGMKAQIVSTNSLYSEGPDVFATYFEREAQHGEPVNSDVTTWILYREAPKGLTLDRSHELLTKHFRPKRSLLEAIDRACGGNRAFDLAIHFRGTDKRRESGLVGHELMLRALEPRMGNARRVFLATDDPAFAAALKEQYRAVEFVSYELGEVREGVPRHFSELRPQEKALEALVNIYLIALAPLCVRTSSYLSAISKIVNPAMQTVTINVPPAAQLLFPEREIRDAERAGDKTLDRLPARGPLGSAGVIREA